MMGTMERLTLFDPRHWDKLPGKHQTTRSYSPYYTTIGGSIK
jgi:hypothetical protein